MPLRAPKGFIDESDPKVAKVGHPAPPWMSSYADLMTELRRLKALPVTPAKVITMPTGRTEGDAFRAMDFGQRQAFIKLWTLTVFPPGTDPRWELTRER